MSLMLPEKITVAFVKEGQMMDLWVQNPYIIGYRNAEPTL